MVATNGSTLDMLRSFSGYTDGGNPMSGLTADRNGTWYGVAATGNPNGHGAVFTIKTNGASTLLYSFGAVTNSAGLPLDGYVAPRTRTVENQFTCPNANSADFVRR